MIRSLVAATVATTALLGAGAAQAGTHWSIGINLPLPAVVVTDSPRYVVQEPAPAYYAPPPVVYAPAPRYVERDVYYAPPPRVVYETAYRDRHWDDRHDDWRWRRAHDRREHWDHDGYGPRHGR